MNVENLIALFFCEMCLSKPVMQNKMDTTETSNLNLRKSFPNWEIYEELVVSS